jgi:muconolactone D-isomerase
MEFLTEVTIVVPDGTSQDVVDELKKAEGHRARELAEEGHLLRLWRPPGPGWRNIGLWRAADETALSATLATLPLHPWMAVGVRALEPHPNDPG